MYKKIMLTITIMMLCVTIVGCNKSLIDTTYAFRYAIITAGDSVVVEGEVSSWLDFENSDQIQVTINGVTYLVHSSNVVLMSKKP